MKVLHVIHAHLPEARGGVQLYLRDLLAAQAKQGLELRVLTGSMQAWSEAGIEPLEGDPRGESAQGWRVHREDHFFDHYAQTWHRGVEQLVARLLEQERPDLVHVHHWLHLTSNLVEIAACLGIPAVVTLHDFHVSCPRCFRLRRDGEPCSRPLGVASCLACVPRYGHETKSEVAASIEFFAEEYRSELDRARAVLVGTAGTADLLASATGLHRERFTVVPLGYSPRLPSRVSLPVWPSAEDPFRFVHWGSLSEFKGTLDLLEAWRRLRARGLSRPAELCLFGEPATPEIEKRLRAAVESDEVEWRSAVVLPDLARQGPHMGVFPTRCIETYGLVLDECMELGLPCIVSAVGALAERAGGAGLRVMPGDPAALATAMASVLADKGVWQRLLGCVGVRSPKTQQHAARVLEVYAMARSSERPAVVLDPERSRRRRARATAMREAAARGLHGSRPR